MKGYQEQNCDIILCGYIRICLSYNAPMDIIDTIHAFYDKTILFDVFCGETNIIKKCKNLATNSDSYFFIDNKDQLNVIGINTDGQLGMKSFEIVLEVTKHIYFVNDDITLISEGHTNEHCFVYASNNLYGFGQNIDGQINDSVDECYYEPVLIEYNFKSKLKQIKCSDGKTLFLTENGNVYGNGSLSYGDLTKQYKNNGYIQCIINTNNIIHIDCLSDSSYFLNNKNILSAVGLNSDGQLCINNESIDYSFEMVLCLNGESVKQFSCGTNHMGCITKSNQLFMYGSNDNCQCGHNNDSPFHRGNEIIIKNKIINQVKCGWEYTIIKTNNNDFYSFGNNNNNKLLIHSNDHTSITPTLISKEYIYKMTKSNKDIIDIIPSRNFTFILQKS